jgi:hypothetical protein
VADKRSLAVIEGVARPRPCALPPCSGPSPKVPGGHVEGSKPLRNAVDPEILGSTTSRAALFQRNGQQGSTGGVIGSTASLNN